MADDPCNCEQRCAHDIRCLGGHANYPADHWYCCNICTPMPVVTWEEARRAGRR